jgi:hypothetical protein
MTRRALILSLVGVVLAAAGLGAAGEGKWVSMFNGKDLAGWEGEPGWWSVQNGLLTGQTTADKPLKYPTYLFWRGGQPGDFEMRALYRLEGKGANSGINFRSKELPKWDVQGYQADLEAGSGGISGILYECNGRAIMTAQGQKVVIDEDGTRHVSPLADAAAVRKAIKADDWNEYVITAKGPEIVLKINGQVTSHVIDREKGKAAARGLITLQLHPGAPMKVQFKDLKVRELK